MQFSTPIEFSETSGLSPLESKITYESRLTFIGSCFATEIGQIMSDLKFDILLNPFGVLYNPASIALSIERLSSAAPFTAADVIVSDNFYTSFHHHSSFSRATEQEFLDNANAQLQMASDRFQKCDTVIVTLGTAHVFRHNKRDIIVSNCHKIPAQEFTRSRLSVDECTEYLENFVAAHPDKRWIFTVSPIRHLKDGAHGNQLSKATLLLALDKICTKYNNAFYFPAYEIMMDELRDYRFYAENMTHPTPQAIRYIFEKFCTFALDPSTSPLMKQAEKELKQAKHRKIRG